MSTLSDGLRQSDRVSFRMPVEAAWATAQGATFAQTVETLLVSRNGGVLRFGEKLETGQELHLRRHIEGEQWKNARARVVAEIDTVKFVNDSKATNTSAARRGIAAYAGEPLRLILGGSLKGESFDELAEGLPPTVRSIDLIGEATDELSAALGRAGRTYRRSNDLATAVGAAAGDAEPGDVVLLSPACASYDQFRDFEQRGETFKRLVGELW